MMKNWKIPGLAAVMAFACAAVAHAQEAAPSMEELAAQVAHAQASADNAWIMTASAIVLMMTAPGLILFYGGLVRSKNVLSVFMHSLLMMGAVSLAWLVAGYSIAFGGPTGEEASPFIGGFDHLFLQGVSHEFDGSGISEMTVMFFQMMFAIITPALMTGAFAERFRFRALVPFAVLWSLILYAPLTHMVWGENGFLNTAIPALDFAGGTVVHISSGVSALVIALYIGKRRNYPGPDFAPHNLVISAIGAGLLWVGWFGFNAGSALAANHVATSAFAATHFSAAAAACSWCAAEWLLKKKPSLLGAISGLVAGLVGVTPAAGFVTPWAGMVIGLVTGVAAFFAVEFLKPKLGYDDSLDVFGIHGVGGMVGAVLTGVVATAAIGAGVAGLIDGEPGRVVSQIFAVLITIGMSVVITGVLIVLIDKTIGIRPTEEEELMGLDIIDHGERGYRNLEAG